MTQIMAAFRDRFGKVRTHLVKQPSLIGKNVHLLHNVSKTGRVVDVRRLVRKHAAVTQSIAMSPT